MREPPNLSPALLPLDHNWGLLREVPVMVLPRARLQLMMRRSHPFIAVETR